MGASQRFMPVPPEAFDPPVELSTVGRDAGSLMQLEEPAQRQDGAGR